MAGERRGASGALLCVLLLLASSAADAGGPDADRGATGPANDAPSDSVRFVWRAGRAQIEVPVDSDSLRIRLPHSWIDPSSTRLWWSDTLLIRGVDYLLDPRRGSFRLVRARPDSARLGMEYRYFPSPIRPEFRRRVPGRASAEPRTEADAARSLRPVEESDGAVRFDLNGTKTVAVEVGSQRDLALRQSLDLAVDGRIGRDVRVRAVLTDRRSPLESDGGAESARLSDLDRILVEVEGPSARMTLGEIRLQLPISEFSRYDRRLEGARGELTPARFQAFAAAASVPGLYVSREFFGQEGKQGPYDLSAPNDVNRGVIVPGSERVYLDGVLLQRGEAADYRIDDAGATLTFTGRHPITAYSEITVEYQLNRERYRRHTYAGGGGIGPSSDAPAGRVRALLLVEGDDRDRPFVALDRIQREALRAAGDSLTPELDSGITFLGPGRGDYDLVTNDTLGVSFFLYQGVDRGSYRVRFDAVGDGKGDYRDSSTTEGERFYRYVGERRGAYLPGAAVPRPERSMLAVVAAEPALGQKARLRAEAAWSDSDPNTFSSRDDGDNQGGAFFLDGRLGPYATGPAQWTLFSSWREVETRFRPVERLDGAFFAQDWSVEASRLERGSSRRSGGLEAAVGGWTSRGTWEDLDNRIDYRGSRGTVETRGRTGPLEWRGRALRAFTRDARETVARKGERATERIEGSWPGAWAALSAGWTAERDERGTGAARREVAFGEWTTRVGTGSRFTRVDASAGWTRRARRQAEGPISRRLDTGDTGLFDARWTRAGGRHLEGSFALRRLVPHGDGARTQSRLGRIRWVERDGSDRVRQEGRWELGTSLRGGREKEIRRVGDGAGRYDSLGVFVGIGDYEIFYRELGDSTRVNRIDFSLRTEFDAGKGGSELRSGDGPRGWWHRLRSTLRVVHTWSAAAETDRDAGWIGARMLPVLSGRQTLPLADMTMRVDLSAWPDVRRFSPRLRGEERRSGRRLLTNAGESTLARTVALLLRSRPADRWTVEQETEWDHTARDVIVDRVGSARDGWRSVRLRLEQKVLLGRGVAVGLNGSGRLRTRLGAPGDARIYDATPYVVWTPGQRNRLEARGTRTSVSRSGGGSAGRLLETPGWDSRIVGTIRIRQELDLSIWFRDRRPDRAEALRDGRLELRATF